MTRVLGALVLASVLAACADDGPPSPTPTEPTPTPPAHADVAGEWTGTQTVSTDNLEGGGCPGDLLRAVPQVVTLDVVVTVEQSGTMLAGRSITTDPDGTETACDISGSVNMNTVDAMLDACTEAATELGLLPGCGAEPWTMEIVGATYVATVEGSSMTGTVRETRTVGAGSETHTATLTSDLTLER